MNSQNYHNLSQEELIKRITELEKSEKIFQLVLNTTFEWETYSDINGNFVYISPNCEKITGYQKEDFVSEPELLKNIIHPEDENIYAQHKNEDFHENDEIKQIEFRIISRNGEEKWIRHQCWMVYDENGKIIGKRANNREITKEKEKDRKFKLQNAHIEVQNKILEKTIRKLSETNDILIQTSKKLEESEIRYRSIFQLSYDPIILIDRDTLAIADVNDAATALYGYSREEFLKMKATDVSVDPDKTDEAINSKNTYVPVRKHFKKDGTIILVEITAAYLELHKKNYLATVIRDISERIKAVEQLKSAHAQLAELNAMKDKFFSIIAHDLKNPFHNVLGLTEVLTDEFDFMEDKTKKEYINYIFESAQLGYNLLDNLLNWSRSQTGRLQFEPKNLNLKELFQESVELHKNVAKYKDIEITEHIDDEIFVFAESNMMMTVFRNLLSNALKFTHKGGSVIVNALVNKQMVEIQIIDTGVGIKPGDIEKLFRLDINLTTVGTAKEIGTGLGLILCKEFVEKNGGKIWVESEVGVGSIFHITLPVAIVS